MMGAVGLELTNFINPELTWKTVAKGNRSSTRRSRKPTSRNTKMGVGQADKSANKTENPSVSESEKLGVAVLGRRFSDKVEHVPIKKRKFIFRSPSPPPRTPSPQHEDSEQLVDSQHSSSNSTSKQQIMASHASKFSYSLDVVFDGRISDAANGGMADGEDFSGIEILAAAACNNSMGEDVNESTMEDGPVLTCEGNDSPISPVPMKETVASSGTAITFQKDVAVEDDMEGPLSHGNSMTGMQGLHNDKDDGALKRSASSRDDRLHWDLNVVMDAWEQPNGYQVDSCANVSAVSEDIKEQNEKLDNLEDCQIPSSGDIENDIETTGRSVVESVVLADVEGDVNMATDSSCEGFRTSELKTEEHKLEVCSTANATCYDEKGITSPIEHALESTIIAASDAKASEEVTVDACLMQSVRPGSCLIDNAQISDLNKNTESRDDCTSDMQLDEPVSIESVEVEKNGVGFSPSPATEVNCEIGRVTDKDGDGSIQISSKEMMGIDICSLEQGHVEVPTNQSSEVHVSHRSPRCDDVPASGAAVIEGQLVETVGVKEFINQVSAADAAEADASVDVGPKELGDKHSEHSTVSAEQSDFITNEVGKNCDYDPANCSGKIDLEDTFEDSYDTDVSQDDRGHLVGSEIVTELDPGYDSQIEDGELRESVVHAWEENEAEDGEAERVDYESDNRDMYDFDAVDYSGPMMGEVVVGSECEKERLLGSNHHCGYEGGETTIDNSKQLCEQSCLGSLAKAAEFSDGGIVKNSKSQSRTQFSRKVDTNIKKRLNTGTDDVAEESEQLAGGSALKERSQTNVAQHDQPSDHEFSADKNVEVNDGRAIGSKATRRELLSRIEGPSYDVIRRKDAVLLRRSRSNNLDDSDPRAERGTDPEKSMGGGRSTLHVNGRGPRDGSWDEHSTGYWDSKRRHSPSYRCPYGSGRPRPRSIVETGGFVMPSDRTISKEGVGLGSVHRQSMNSSSKGVYHPLVRRRSPSDRDDAYAMHMGMTTGRDASPDRSRGRSRRYQGVHRGPRDSYHASIPDETSAEFALRVPHHIARRDRSISPTFNRGAPHFSETHKISQSRSGSRSPPAWLISRERNASSRHFSRSPDFRSGTRMERIRLPPFQKPHFAVDYGEGFLSPPRGRISPQHNSRWVDDRNGVMDHFRDGRSPVRMFQQSQRFDPMGPPRRLKSNDYYRPMIHPGRLPEMAGTGRGRKHDDSDEDRRKHGDRYEMIRPMRRYDADGVVKRFRYGTEDCFLSHNPHNNEDCIRGTDRRSRDIPRRASEEKRHLRYNHERLYNSSPTSFGMRDYDEDVSPRRGRPA